MNRFGDIDFSFKRLPPVYGYHSAKLVSIEKALEPIESQIDELPRYIKVAKRYCHFPSEHRLTHDESAAVYIYTMEWGETTLYRVLNKALRSENRQALKIWFPYLKLFDTALDKLPTVREVVWRGVPLGIGKNFTKNQLVTWWSVNSCSSSVDVIKNFLGNNKSSTLFLIEAMNGKQVSGYTEYENEDEVILRIGTQFRVKSNALDHPNSSYVVHLVETDDNNDEKNVTTAVNELHVAAGSSNQGALAHLNIPTNAKWIQNGITVVGGNRQGNRLNQLSYPCSIYIDDDQTIYVADCRNHRIVEWKNGTTSGQIVAGENGQGNRNDQLNCASNVIIDKESNSLIISDSDNSRVVRWPRRNGTSGETIISNIDCSGLAMDNNGYLYVCDCNKREVRRWKIGETNGVVVAGGNGKGNRLDQLNHPCYIFVAQDYSVYVSDMNNHRVMKWMKGAKEGIIVAGGQRQGNSLTQLSYPHGIIVDALDTVYVADPNNHRVIRWLKEAREGGVIVGGNGEGEQANQFKVPADLSFDRENNLYVLDRTNSRVQKFYIEQNSN